MCFGLYCAALWCECVGVIAECVGFALGLFGSAWAFISV